MENNISRKKQIKADLMLFFVTLFWGVSYGLVAVSLREIDTFNLTTYRFLGAFFIVFILAYKRLNNVTMKTLYYSCIIGFLLFLVYICCTYAVLYTSISNAGFLCGLAVIFTPIFSFLFLGKKFERKFIYVVIMCVVGLGLLTLKEDFTLAFGDILSIGCAVFYTIDLLITEKAVNHNDVDPFQLGVFQLLFTGVFSGIAALIIEGPQVPKTKGVWAAVIFLTVFCTGIAFITQCIAQQYTTASHVGVIFTLEPVISCGIAFVFFDEILSGKAYLGAALLVASILLMEVELPRKKEK